MTNMLLGTVGGALAASGVSNDSEHDHTVMKFIKHQVYYGFSHMITTRYASQNIRFIL